MNNDCIEIIVVDNGFYDGICDYFKQIFLIRMIFNKINEGFVKVCNQGFEVVLGDSILFLNNDIIVIN